MDSASGGIICTDCGTIRGGISLIEFKCEDGRTTDVIGDTLDDFKFIVNGFKLRHYFVSIINNKIIFQILFYKYY
jgi:hypothetical protein